MSRDLVCAFCAVELKEAGNLRGTAYEVTLAYTICNGNAICFHHFKGPDKPSITGKELGEMGGIPGVTKEDVEEFLKEIGR